MQRQRLYWYLPPSLLKSPEASAHKLAGVRETLTFNVHESTSREGEERRGVTQAFCAVHRHNCRISTYFSMGSEFDTLRNKNHSLRTPPITFISNISCKGSRPLLGDNMAFQRLSWMEKTRAKGGNKAIQRPFTRITRLVSEGPEVNLVPKRFFM